jgi:post-segregation antitoxin (ccd killing protein)
MVETVTLELDADLLARAREAPIDVSALLENALRRESRSRPPEADRERVAHHWYFEKQGSR